jgi:dihydrolipoamide dehydrogenase
MARLIIIGAGPGGYETAVEAAAKGLEVTLVTDGPLGGTCLNEGCIPTKALCRAAALHDDILRAGEFGIHASLEGVDFPAVMARKDAVVEQLRGGIGMLLKKVCVVEGRASLVDAHTVEVAGTRYEADYIILATGSVSASLPIEGADLCITSKEALEFTSVPPTMVVIGGGVIGLELASIYCSFGCDVTIVEFCKNILPRFDDDISKRLKQSLVKRGIKIETSAQVQAVRKAPGGGYSVSYLQKDKECSVEGSVVLMAVGRRPNTDSLNLADLGIEFGRRGVAVNAYMQTNVPSVYAIGDLVGGMMLAHAATFHGKRALNHILAGQPSSGEVDGIDLSLVPAAVFTVPEAGCVGLTEAECEGREIRVLKSFFRANGKAIAMGEPDGFCKMIVDASTERILGCHMFGAESSILIQEVSALMSLHATLSQFRSVIHAHPTLSEVLQSLA